MIKVCRLFHWRYRPKRVVRPKIGEMCTQSTLFIIFIYFNNILTYLTNEQKKPLIVETKGGTFGLNV